MPFFLVGTIAQLPDIFMRLRNPLTRVSEALALLLSAQPDFGFQTKAVLFGPASSGFPARDALLDLSQPPRFFLARASKA